MREMSRHQNTSIGLYHLGKLIGVGPVSCVYLAERQDRAERQMVLKLFEAVPFNSLEEKDRALDEVRLLASLEHPSILPTLDDGLYENMLYQVAPYIEAGSLRQRLTAAAGELLPLKETMTLLRQVGEALQFAHTQQIVHANLKPENILLQAEGTVLLADFLLPSLVKSERAARILSTFAAFYMAPEQFQGIATPLSDQYALACLAYELLTGCPPFEADDFMGLARKHLSKEPLQPSQLQPKRAQHIDNVLLKALVKRPEGRYPDIQTFLAELSAPPPLPVLMSTPEVTPVAAQFQEAEALSEATLQQAFPLSFAGFEQEPAQPLPQKALSASLAGFEQEPTQQFPQRSLPASLAIFEHETLPQAPLEAWSAAVVPNVHEAPTLEIPLATLGMGANQQRGFGSARSQQAILQARARTAPRLSPRQIWLTVGLVALAMLLSISGFALFFNNSSASHTPSNPSGSIVGASSTAVSSQTIPGAPTPTAGKHHVLPTATATPSLRPTPGVTPTPSVTPTTSLAAGFSCRVDYKLSSRWSNGFVANLTITNTSTSAIQGWTLVFAFSNGEQITNGWDGKFTQNGGQVSIADAGFNASLAPGSSTTPGFQATSSGGNLMPKSFSLNGVACGA